MKFDSACTLLMAASLGILSEHGCNGQNETLLRVNETFVLNETHAVAENQQYCPTQETIETFSGGRGEPLSCSRDAFAYQVCGSVKGQDCPGSYHQLFCKTKPDLELTPLVGPESEWLPTLRRQDNPRIPWAECPDNWAVSSRCGSGGNVDCNLPDQAVHGIKCRELSPEFFLRDEVTYSCAGWGQLATCPEGYFMVGSCGSGSNYDCDQFGCSGGESSAVGVKCRKYGHLHDLVWDFSAEPKYDIEIIDDYNPLVGLITDLDVSLESTARVSASASLEFNLEFSADVEVEANLLSLFGFPTLRGIFGGNELVDLGVEVEANAEATFEAAAEAQLRTDIQGQVFTYAVSPLDSWGENFVRLVRYRRNKVQDVIGTVKCCGCDQPEMTIKTAFEESQTGFIALHIKKYPGLDLDTIESREFVELYLSGEIVDFKRGPFRAFVSEQGFLERCWARLFG